MGIMDINLNGAFFLAREAARYMEKKGTCYSSYFLIVLLNITF